MAKLRESHAECVGLESYDIYRETLQDHWNEQEMNGPKLESCGAQIVMGLYPHLIITFLIKEHLGVLYYD